MGYNFDEIIDRRGTNSVKHDFAVESGMPENVIPLFVADMDFKSPPAVSEVIQKVAQHGIFGYTGRKADYFESVYNWYKNRFNWDIDEEWLIRTPSVVFAIATAIRALTDVGDGVLIQRPVYTPFSNLINSNNRKLVNNPLVYEDGRYRIDFDDFEAKIIKHKVKLFILCNPHNPISRVWTKEELIRLGDICTRYGVIVVSDEIHGDFVYPGYQHHVFANLKPEFLNNTITCTSPSKTFNLAGLQVSNIFIANKELRDKFKAVMTRTGYGEISLIGSLACQAAYNHGADWLDELLLYLWGNIGFVRSFLQEHIPQVKLTEPQGTYLLWLDFNGLDMTEEERQDLIIRKANLWLYEGTIFGAEGKGFERVNIASPRSILKKAFHQLAEAFQKK